MAMEDYFEKNLYHVNVIQEADNMGGFNTKYEIIKKFEGKVVENSSSDHVSGGKIGKLSANYKIAVLIKTDLKHNDVVYEEGETKRYFRITSTAGINYNNSMQTHWKLYNAKLIDPSEVVNG